VGTVVSVLASDVSYYILIRNGQCRTILRLVIGIYLYNLLH
jgi:hypothetical protein